MDKDFQDRIDEYLLHSDTMSEEAKADLLERSLYVDFGFGLPALQLCLWWDSSPLSLYL